MKKIVKVTRAIFRLLHDIFDDRLTRAAGIVCLMIIVIVIFNMNSNLSETYPLLGTFVFFMVPILFILGGVIFIMAILKFSKQEGTNEPS